MKYSKDDLAPSVQGKLVFKDQCNLCFHTSGGVNLSLKTFNSFCEKHLPLAAHKFGLRLFLNVALHRVQVAGTGDKPVTKLAIGVEGGFNDTAQVNYQPQYREFIFLGGEKHHVQGDQALRGLVESVKQTDSAFKKQSLATWQCEARPCEHTLTLIQEPSYHNDLLKGLTCNKCSLSAGLWFCLGCGHVGCGRKNYDGSGGNGHALQHFQEEGRHPLVVKLGTITSEGQASLYCYACNDDVVDNFLQAHLLVFGIIVEQQLKTEKTIAELNLELNLNARFLSKLIEGNVGGQKFGPGFTGIQNIGNSCYMNAVLQILKDLPPVVQNYVVRGRLHSAECKKVSSDCKLCQVAKLFIGLQEGQLAERKTRVIKSEEGTVEEEYQEGIAPYDFKRIMAEKNPDFVGFKQQDALQYLQWVLDQLSKLQAQQHLLRTASHFQFTSSNLLTCLKCGSCRLVDTKTNQLELPVEIPTMEMEAVKESAEEPEYKTSFKRCVQLSRVGTHLALACQSCGSVGFSGRQYLRDSPQFLLVKVNRFVATHLMEKKLNALIEVPDQFDFHELFMKELPEGIKIGSDQPAIDQAKLSTMVEMGFDRNVSAWALVKNKGDLQAASAWYFENMDAPEFKSYPSAKRPTQAGPKQEDVDQIINFGFTETQAKAALLQFKGIEAATNYLFERDGNVSELMHLLAPKEEVKDQKHEIVSTRYRLRGGVVHLGRGVHSGHYVAYSRAGGEWMLYNDNRVNASEHRLDKAYFYLFERI